MVSNIHKEMADEDIKNWFRGLTENGEIIYISRCYKIRDQSVREKIIMDLKRKKRALRLEEKEAEERRKETGEVVHREICTNSIMKCPYTSTAEDFFIGILSFLSSIIVTLINIALEKIIRHLSSFERHDSYTKFNLSVSIKLTIATFINTGILPIFQNIETHNWFHTNGLMNAIFYNMISIALVGPFLYAFDFWYIVKRIKMKYQEKKGENCTLTQREAHALFEPPPVDMAQLHSDTMLMMFMVAMYVFILPVVAIIACFGSIVQFCVQRYLILRRHKQPPQLGPELATMFVKLSPFMILIYGVSLFIFHSVIISQQRTAASLLKIIEIICAKILIFSTFIYSEILLLK